MLWEDKSKYEGEFVNGMMEGKGIKTWPNGDKYEGMWQNDLQHGPGLFYNAKTNKETPEEYREGKRWSWNKTAKLAGSRSIQLASREGWAR